MERDRLTREQWARGAEYRGAAEAYLQTAMDALLKAHGASPLEADRHWIAKAIADVRRARRSAQVDRVEETARAILEQDL